MPDQSLLRRFVRGSLSVGVGSFSVLSFGLISMILAVRHMPADEYGAFVLLLVVANFLIEISGFGLNLAVPKFMTGSEDAAFHARLVNSALIFRIAASVLASILGLLARGWLADLFGSTTFFDLIAYLPVLVLLLGTTKLQQGILQGLFLFRPMGVANTVASGMNFILTTLLVLVLDSGALGLVYARIISLAMAAIYMLTQTPLSKKFQVDFTLLARMIRFGLPLQANYLMTFFFLRLDTLIIATLLGPTQVAYFEIARKIPENATLAYDAFRAVFYPYVARFYAEGEKRRLSNFINQSIRWLSLAGIAVSLFAFLFAPEIVVLLFSERYIASTVAFALLMFGLNLLVIDYTLGYSLVAIGDSGKPLYVNITKTVVSLGANVILIPVLGIAGAAIASLAGYVVGSPLNAILLRRRGLSIQLRYFFQPLAVCAAVMVITAVVKPDSVIEKLALFALFPMICFLTSIVTVGELKMLFEELSPLLRRSKKTQDSVPAAPLPLPRTDGSDKLRILIITDTLPYPPVSGNRLRVYHLSREMAENHEVWMIAPERPGEASHDSIEHMQAFCHTVITTPYVRRSKPQHLLGMLHYLLTDRPPELRFEFSQGMVGPLRQLTETVDFDIVHIEPSYIALYRELLPPSLQARAVLAYHNIEYDLFSRIAKIEPKGIKKVRAWFHSQFLRRWEPRYAGKFMRCITCSERDQRILEASNPNARVEVVPNGVDTYAYVPLEPHNGPPALVFVGSMSYVACADGATFFHNEVLPQVRASVADVETWFVGRDPLPQVLALQGEGVHVTGWVDAIVPYYERATLAIVPLRAGGGTRLKILEAMALGRAVVSTSIGCEGLEVVDGENIMIADDPQEFAEKVIALLTDVTLRQKIVNNARTLVERQYDWRSLAESQIRIYRDVTQNGHAMHEVIAPSSLAEGQSAL